MICWWVLPPQARRLYRRCDWILPLPIPLHEMPNLLSFCELFACYDVDGMRTGAAYMVQKTRAADLRTFLLRPSDERRLPIVLVTPNPDHTFPLDYRKLAQLLCGVAHVMVLNPQNYWKNADISAVHGCLGGAVRLYRPAIRSRSGCSASMLSSADGANGRARQAGTARQDRHFSGFCCRRPAFCPAHPQAARRARGAAGTAASACLGRRRPRRTRSSQGSATNSSPTLSARWQSWMHGIGIWRLHRMRCDA